MTDKNRSKKDVFVILLLGVLSVFFVYFASSTTSPFYPYYYGYDSAMFQTIGKWWKDGRIPYIDMFDHKGPAIFFVNMLGYCLTDSSAGVMLIQMVFMFATLYALYKTARLVSDSRRYGIFAVLISLSVIHFAYSQGNMTEEYCLPFLSFSTYYQVKYLMDAADKKGREHKPLQAFLYGLTFGVCLMTRVTNAAAVCAGTLVICCLLVRDKKIKNLLCNAAGFIGGFLLVVLPFAVYFAAKDAFYELIHGTLLFNIGYQTAKQSWIMSASLRSAMEFLIVHFSAIVIFVTAVLALRRKKTALAVYCLLCGILETYLFTSGSGYGHYSLITLPQTVLFLNEVSVMRSDKEKVFRKLFLGLTAAFSVVCAAVLVYRVIDLRREYRVYREVGYEQLLSAVPEEDRDSFVAYGMNNDFEQLYLLHDISSCYKFFTIQEWNAEFSEKTREEIHRVFQEGNAEWILTEEPTEVIRDVLDSRYEAAGENAGYKLYHLKTSGTE